jgi:hypothetical protein
MAEFSSGSEPSTAVGASSADGHVHARSPRLPQAQAENILASLASRSAPSDGAVQSKLPPPRPPAGNPPSAGQTAPTEHAGAGHGPGADDTGPKPGPHAVGPKAKSHVTGGTVARPAHEESTATGPRIAGGPYTNDILPAKTRSRFHFRFR